MGLFEKFMEAWMPACLTFGPAFLVIAAKSPRGERFLRILGVVMVSAALVHMWLTVDRQRGDISVLETRLQYLDEKVRGGGCGAEATMSDSRPVMPAAGAGAPAAKE